jgi:pimeloyl-ACP methyl ester carboxylesterase
VVYVDSGPVADGTVPDPALAEDAIELPLPPFDALEGNGTSLAGLGEEALARFRDRAVPHPAGAIREAVVLRNDARNAVPATVVCCSFPSHAIQNLAAGGNPMFAPLTELRDVAYLDLPTGHWPMWSEPERLAEILAAAAR